MHLLHELYFCCAQKGLLDCSGRVTMGTCFLAQLLLAKFSVVSFLVYTKQV